MKKKGIKILFNIFLIIILVWLVKGIPKFLVIKKIVCRNQFGICNLDLVENLNQTIGRKYPQGIQIIKGILSQNRSVKAYSYHFNLPGNIIIDVIEKKPLFALKKNEEYFLIDKDGDILSTILSTNLPYLVIASEKEIGKDKIDTNLLFSLEILRYMEVLYQTKSGVIEGDKININLANGPKIIFPMTGDVKVLIGSLNLILQSFQGDNKNLRIEKEYNQATIDLSFKNPIIR